MISVGRHLIYSNSYCKDKESTDRKPGVNILVNPVSPSNQSGNIPILCYQQRNMDLGRTKRLHTGPLSLKKIFVTCHSVTSKPTCESINLDLVYLNVLRNLMKEKDTLKQSEQTINSE